jgi:hypothetical protein
VVPPPSHAPTLAAGVTPLTNLLPQDIADPSTQCTPDKNPGWTSPGLVSGLDCTATGLPNGLVDAYQLDNAADYNTTWQNVNSALGFDSSTAGGACPPSGNGGQGHTPWFGHNGNFPQMTGQVLECWTGANAAPTYVWAMPTQDAFFIAQGANGSAFTALDTWWTNNALPLNPPTVTPSPQSS